MARVGIRIDDALGVSVPDIRRIAKRAGIDQALADGLWATGIHEARYLATMVADPAALTAAQMDRWAADIDSWDVGDAAADLFAASPLRERKIRAWAAREEPFVKRAAFAMIARRAVSDRAASDAAFTRLLRADPARRDRRSQRGQEGRQLGAAPDREAEPRAERRGHPGGGADPRRWTGQRLPRLARWVGRDVLRELRAGGTQERLG